MRVHRPHKPSDGQRTREERQNAPLDRQRDARIMPRLADLSKVNQSNAILC
jgi:hypothetical protein